MMNEGIMPNNLKMFERNIERGYLHNIYLLQTIDSEGNITGEAYGRNLMTDFGMNKIWRGSPTEQFLYVGGGDQTPRLDNKSLYVPYVELSSAITTSRSEKIEPFEYDKTTHMYSCKVKILECYFDYNVDGVTEDLDIKEFGYGSSYDNLTFHSNVFDINGNKTTITKHLNEKLIITFWISGCVNIDIINEAYNKGQYMFISPYFFTRCKNDLKMSVSAKTSADNYKTNHGEPDKCWVSDISEVFNNNMSNHVLNGSIIIPPSMYDNKYDYVSAMLFTEGDATDIYISYKSNFFIITFDELTEPEELSSKNIYTNNYSTSDISSSFSGVTFSNKSGEDNFKHASGEIPVSNFSISTLSMYNCKTREWDIEESFKDAPDRDFNNITGKVYGSIRINIDGVISEAHVFINPHPEIKLLKILSLDNPVYATDEYWDVDTYERIYDDENIPEELSKKRYYIILTTWNSATLFTHDMGYHELIPKSPYYSIYESNVNIGINETVYYGLTRPCSSDEYEWFASYEEIIYPNKSPEIAHYPISYKINDISSTDDRFLRWSTDKGDRLILGYFGGFDDMFNEYNFQSFKIYNTTDSDNPSSYNTLEKIFDNTSPWGLETEQPYISWTGNGFLCVQKFSGNKCGILDVYDETSYVLSNVDFCHALNLTNNCVYLRTDIINKKTFEIYDMKNKVVIDTFNLPREPDSINGIFGWKDYIYISTIVSGSESIYFYDITKHQASKIEENNIPSVKIKVGYSWKNRTDVSVDDVYIIAHANEDTKWISTDDLKTTHLMVEDKNNVHHNVYREHMLCQLKYINEGKQLIYVFSTQGSQTHNVIDMGQVRDSIITKYPIGHQFIANPYNSDMVGYICIYKLGVIYGSSNRGGVQYFPIEQTINHKMTGTTRTITAYNDPFQISDKQYSFSITNDMSKVIK